MEKLQASKKYFIKISTSQIRFVLIFPIYFRHMKISADSLQTFVNWFTNYFISSICFYWFCLFCSSVVLFILFSLSRSIKCSSSIKFFLLFNKISIILTSIYLIFLWVWSILYSILFFISNNPGFYILSAMSRRFDCRESFVISKFIIWWLRDVVRLIWEFLDLQQNSSLKSWCNVNVFLLYYIWCWVDS